MKTMRELIDSTISSQPVSDESVLACSYGIEYYDLRLGQDGCTAENVGQYRAALQSLHARLVELRAAEKAAKAASRPVYDGKDLEILEQITSLEAQAQEFVDRDQLGKAQKLGQQIRALRAQLQGAR